MNTTEKRANPTPSSIPITDPRYPIWGRLFLCKVPRIAYYSTNYLENFGLHSSGNHAIDREMARQPQTVYITINDMVEHYHVNQCISIVKQEDVKTIYEICQDYTFDYGDRLNRTVFSHDVPFGDLVKLDEFAEAVYQHAGHQYGDEFARTFLPKNVMDDIADISKLFSAIDDKVRRRGKEKEDHYTVHNAYSPNAMRKEEKAESKSDVDRAPLPARPSMRDVFMAYMGGGEKGDRYADR